MIAVQAADSSMRTTALRLLFARFPVEEQSVRLREALKAADKGTLNLKGLLIATAGEMPVGAALVMPQDDGVALVWPPLVSCGATDETAVEDALMNEICRRLDQPDIRLGQALLLPDDLVEEEMLGRHGFTHAADLFFLALTLPNDALSDESENRLQGHRIDREIYQDSLADRFAAVIEQSYRESLDCPFLKGFRTGAEALASHKLSGVFDPIFWSLYRVDGVDAGVLLLSPHPDQNSMELVYMGVIPEMRRRGLGQKMLTVGLQECSTLNFSSMFLAVDAANDFANGLYGKLSFVELARRRIMLRQKNGSAHQ